MYGYFFDKENGKTVTICEEDDETGVVTDIFDHFDIPDVKYNTAKLRLNSDGSVCAFELWDDHPDDYYCACAGYRLYFPDGDHIDSWYIE